MANVYITIAINATRKTLYVCVCAYGSLVREFRTFVHNDNGRFGVSSPVCTRYGDEKILCLFVAIILKYMDVIGPAMGV